MSSEQIINTYASYSKNRNIRNISSSGAVFYELAKYVFSLNGVVYGVGFEENFKSVCFKRVTSLDALTPLLGSKYMQASMKDTYKSIKDDLNQGLYVLFTGTGCQINGLCCFLGKIPSNLFCVEIVCHGTPSSLAWSKYIDQLESQEHSSVLSVDFRNKKNGWQNYGMRILFENQNTLFIERKDNPYMKMFLNNYCLRPSCYNCVPKSHKLSDMVIGDFWGIDDCLKDFNDDRGVSLVLIRSKKGQDLFDGISDCLVYEKVDYSQAVLKNPSEYRSVRMPKERLSFYEDLSKRGFLDTAKRYPKFTVKRFIKNTIKAIKNK